MNFKVLAFLIPLLTIGFIGWRFLIAREERSWVDARFGAILLLPAVGLTAPSIAIYYGVIALVMIAVPRSRTEAIGLFVLVALLLPSSTLLLQAGGTRLFDLDTTRVAALGLLPSLRFPRSRKVPESSAFALIGVLLVLLMIIIDTRIPGTNFTVILRATIEHSTSTLIPFLFLINSVGKEEDQRRPMFYLLMAGFMLSIVATFEMLRHWPLYQVIDSNLGVRTGLSKALAVRGGLLRSPGPFFESTTFGLFLAVTTICTVAMRSAFRAPWAHQAAIAVGCMGTVSALARNAWIGLVVGLLVLFMYRGQRALAFAVAGFAAFGLLVVQLAPENGTLGALTGKSGHASQTGDYRERLVEYSMPKFWRSPILGNPIDSLRADLRTELRSRKLSVDFVNSYLYFAVATGLPGLIVFVLLFAYPLFRLFKYRRIVLASGVNGDVATAIAGSLAALALMALGTSFYERIPLLALLMLGMSRNVLSRSRRPIQSGQAVARPKRKPLVLDIAPQGS